MAYNNVTAEEFRKIQEKNTDAVVLDVRTPAEVRQGKIPGATNLDVTGRSFGDDLNKLNKDKTYLLYCRSGARSAQACDYMSSKGFKNLYNLNGCISRWPFKTE